ncbi:MAG: phosphatidate cytidylyltransferase [Candidatus Hydrogenedentes bacterium]|nr:phosphatidate cytidylyltransferase [Candidatus Hydrogenedentota bacterium]
MTVGGSGLLTRWITALAVLSGVLALIWVPGLHWGLTLFVAFIAGVALYEYYGLALKTGAQPQVVGGIATGVAVVLSGYFGEPMYTNAALMAAIVIVAFLHVTHPPPSAAGIASSVFGTIYAGWFPAHILLLHAMEGEGPGVVMTLLVAVALTDTAAYFVGKNFGSRPLAPVVSPKKTWEGAIGGFVFAVLGMAVLCGLRMATDWTALPDWSLPRYMLSGAGVSAVAQVGDLVASSFKRDADVKDSGGLFPGHGGALDRCDGFLFGAPVLYYMAVL